MFAVPALLMGLTRIFVCEMVSASSQVSFLALFIAFSVGTLLASPLTESMLASMLISLSKSLHNKMLDRVGRAPMSFFF